MAVLSGFKYGGYSTISQPHPTNNTTTHDERNKDCFLLRLFFNYMVKTIKNLSKERVSIRKSLENMFLFRSPVSPLTSSGAPGNWH
jgi:hypothetical protein